MSLAKRELRVIERAVNTKCSTVKWNKTWQALHERYAVGRRQGNKLYLNHHDLSELIKIVRGATGLNLLEHSIDDFGDRIDTAGKIAFEKMSGQGVAHDMVLIRSLSGTVQLDASYQHPPEGLLWIPLEQALQCKHSCMLVVENLAAIRHLHKAQLPSDLIDQNPLVVYRGDKAHSPLPAKQLMEALEMPVYVFPDADPAGIQIALTVPYCKGLVLPEVTAVPDFTMANHALINDQHRELYALKQRVLPSVINSYLEVLLKHGGITQEASIAHGLPLSLMFMSQPTIHASKFQSVKSNL